ncbi:A/G-specific adenine glycosylase [Gracilinema caldarium]|uniref:Adenine DNA glycosylase n=1 Tax=Gracilinema caldarium (strain ATCC 51460 / DSM 7334 / H1) TaxID=744872 RepID=F8F0L1_GRAC1|nr:A/G-specific adenine glycosylase [Gracilinema caldarium]AEJ19718.1 helix-hairpin-helix motif protein [Gracilinema caldarium DSM 7334]
METDHSQLPEQHQLAEFRRTVWKNYREQGRSFPWRHINDSWGILVSEVMLQQTQTNRVVPYWLRWMEKWPTPLALASVSMDEVLREWAGLGYNRRGRNLKLAAETIVSTFNGQVPRTRDSLLQLPGIGPYTAGAILCFAFNEPVVFIETNIRSVLLHFFFQDEKKVPDSQLIPILEQTLDRQNPREWYYALMDYGAQLKKITVNPNRRSAHYSRQSPFKGSLREARGFIVRELATRGPISLERLAASTTISYERLKTALDSLVQEQMVAEQSGRYMIQE